MKAQKMYRNKLKDEGVHTKNRHLFKDQYEIRHILPLGREKGGGERRGRREKRKDGGGGGGGGGGG